MPAVSTRANTVAIKFHFIVFPLSQELTNYLDRKQMRITPVKGAVNGSNEWDDESQWR